MGVGEYKRPISWVSSIGQELRYRPFARKEQRQLVVSKVMTLTELNKELILVIGPSKIVRLGIPLFDHVTQKNAKR